MVELLLLFGLLLYVVASNAIYGLWIRYQPRNIRRMTMVKDTMMAGRTITYDDYKFYGLLDEYEAYLKAKERR